MARNYMAKDWNWPRSQEWEEDDHEVGHQEDHVLQEEAIQGKFIQGGAIKVKHLL